MKDKINDIIYLAKIIKNYLTHPMNKEVREYADKLMTELQAFKEAYIDK